MDISAEQKVDEIPYDFIRKRLSVIVAGNCGQRRIITKGALSNVLKVCSSIQDFDTTRPLDVVRRADIAQPYHQWSEHGFRVLGMATRAIGADMDTYSRDDESELQFAGFLLFFDPPKSDVAQTITDLRARGVRLKIVTSDNQYVARHVAESVNLQLDGLLTGNDLNEMGDEALWHAAEQTSIFAEVDPNQKGTDHLGVAENLT